MEPSEIIAILNDAFTKKPKIKNAAMDKGYKYAKSLKDLPNNEKENMIIPLLKDEGVYSRFWGAFIALSYKILIKESIITLLHIMDIDRKTSFEIHMLQEDIGRRLYDYRKHGYAGSYPGQYKNEKYSMFPNYDRTIKHYRRKYKIKDPNKK